MIIIQNKSIMKIVIQSFILFLIAILIVSCGSKRVMDEETRRKGNITYYQSKPFTGIAFSVDNDGQLLRERSFKNGILNGSHKIWHKNGQLKEEGDFKNGKENGKFKGWYKSGELEYECGFTEGVYDGLTRRWYKNGQLEYEGRFDNGKFVGVHKSYKRDGQLEKENKFSD